MLHPEISAKR